MPTKRWAGAMPLSIRIRWFVIGFLEQQIQTMITERILMYDKKERIQKVMPTKPADR